MNLTFAKSNTFQNLTWHPMVKGAHMTMSTYLNGYLVAIDHISPFNEVTGMISPEFSIHQSMQIYTCCLWLIVHLVILLYPCIN